jgi:hypothetical protein
MPAPGVGQYGVHESDSPDTVRLYEQRQFLPLP